jgi:hypothetical protein
LIYFADKAILAAAAKKDVVRGADTLRRCPCCKTGTLITIDVFGKRGPPKKYLLEKQPASVVST